MGKNETWVNKHIPSTEAVVELINYAEKEKENSKKNSLYVSHEKVENSIARTIPNLLNGGGLGTTIGASGTQYRVPNFSAGVNLNTSTFLKIILSEKRRILVFSLTPSRLDLLRLACLNVSIPVILAFL